MCWIGVRGNGRYFCVGWAVTLGKTATNWKRETMNFEKNGHLITLRDIKSKIEIILHLCEKYHTKCGYRK